MSMEDKAYEFAAAFRGIDTKGNTPTVKFVNKLEANGRPIVGKYRHYSIPFIGWVIWDRIWVVANGYKWSCTCHEMSHALDARLGKPRDEALAEQVEAFARQAGQPE